MRETSRGCASTRRTLRSRTSSPSTLPTNASPFLEASAFSPTFLIYLHAPAYWKRLLAASDDEAREAYALYRRQVQIFLMRAEGRRWVSKSPAHMGFLGSLAEAFPGLRHRQHAPRAAGIDSFPVQPHRDDPQHRLR